MKGFSKMSALFISGTFLFAGAVTADPGNDEGRGRAMLEQQSRDCSYSHNCRSLGPKSERHDRANHRRPNYADNRHDTDRRPDYHDYRHDDDRRSYRHRDDDDRRWYRDRDDDDRRKPRVDFRIITYPAYRAPAYYGGNRPPYWYPAHGHRPRYYYREYGLSPYPNQPAVHGRDDGRIFWNDDRRSPRSLYQRETEGQYCREYHTEAEVNGRRQQVYGTACQQPDGSWEIID